PATPREASDGLGQVSRRKTANREEEPVTPFAMRLDSDRFGPSLGKAILPNPRWSGTSRDDTGNQHFDQWRIR
ncbi:MAG TPA: hypothetical protein VGN42_23895, partial [Pirellulales bacterium]|nr:hypothetical protein [Pirellulales bacterium]